MGKILCDCWLRKENFNGPYQGHLKAIHSLYGWLYETGIMARESFAYREYAGAVYFAIDLNDLIPYRDEFFASDNTNAKFAWSALFEKRSAYCRFTGAFQLMRPMYCHREEGDSDMKSIELTLVQRFSNEEAYRLLDISLRNGTKAAVCELFNEVNWENAGTVTKAFVAAGVETLEPLALANKLRATVSQSKRKLLDTAARRLAKQEDIISAQETIIAELRSRLEMAERCIDIVSDEFDRGHCHNGTAEAVLQEWYDSKK